MLFALLLLLGCCCFCCCFWLRFSRCCCLNGSLYIYIFMFRLTLKDFLSIIGSINTWVPIFFLSPFVHAIVIWTVSIVAASSHLLCVWFRHTLTVLASIICNHSACLSSFCVYIYIYAILLFEYFVVHRVSEPYFYHHHYYYLFITFSFFFPFVGFLLWF